MQFLKRGSRWGLGKYTSTCGEILPLASSAIIDTDCKAFRVGKQKALAGIFAQLS